MSAAIQFGIVAGEKSGDILGAGLIRALRELYPDAQFSGVGGPEMERLGCRSLAPMERLAVMGLVEPLGRLPELLRIKRSLTKHFLTERPAAFIGIDSPDFNLRLSARLRQGGLPTVHYVSPSVWAWRKGRIHGIAKSVDLMLTLFPFETGIYGEHGVEAHCVGHPLADMIDPAAGDEPSRQGARRALSLDSTAPVLALLPGSRSGEILRMAPVFLAAAALARSKYPALRFVIPCAGDKNRRLLEEIIARGGFAADGFCLTLDSRQALTAADFAILSSGTASLEAMLLRRPMVVCYKLAALSYLLASRMVEIEHMAIPNLLAGRRLVPEYVQSEVSPENLLREIEAFMARPSPAPELVDEFVRQHGLLRRNASQAAAAAIRRMLKEDTFEVVKAAPLDAGR